MLCLSCLARDSARRPEDVLADTRDYILLRPCFKKEWLKYPAADHCPQPEMCFPQTCFADGDLADEKS